MDREQQSYHTIVLYIAPSNLVGEYFCIMESAVKLCESEAYTHIVVFSGIECNVLYSVCCMVQCVVNYSVVYNFVSDKNLGEYFCIMERAVKLWNEPEAETYIISPYFRIYDDRAPGMY